MKNWTLSYPTADKENFEAIRKGIKSIETRPGISKYKMIKVGDTITFTCNGAHFTKEVVKRYHWPSPEALVREVHFKKVLPSANTTNETEGAFENDPEYTENMATWGMFGFGLSAVE